MKILIVDDGADMRSSMRRTLETLTQDIHEAGNVVEALRLTRAERPDIVILGTMTAGVDGYEVCYRIKTVPELKHTRVIMLTARAQDIDVSIGLRAFADAYLTKPFDPAQLLPAIAKLQGGERA